MPAPPARAAGARANVDPRKQQIRALCLQLRQARIELQQVNMQLQQLHNQYGQGAPFVPYGLINRVYREVENIQLSGPQQRKQQLQQQIISLEQQILALESQMSS
jgi:multidrug resistance efflux pump